MSQVAYCCTLYPSHPMMNGHVPIHLYRALSHQLLEQRHRAVVAALQESHSLKGGQGVLLYALLGIVIEKNADRRLHSLRP